MRQYSRSKNAVSTSIMVQGSRRSEEEVWKYLICNVGDIEGRGGRSGQAQGEWDSSFLFRLVVGISRCFIRLGSRRWWGSQNCLVLHNPFLQM
jgi:hypothetical protein